MANRRLVMIGLTGCLVSMLLIGLTAYLGTMSAWVAVSIFVVFGVVALVSAIVLIVGVLAD